MDQRSSILALATAYAQHRGVTHWAVSQRIFRKGDFFARLEGGGDVRTRTAARALAWFSANWPEDLAWPEEIQRPKPEPAQRSGEAA